VETNSGEHECSGSSGRDFDVVVSGPGGVAVPVRCYQQRDGNLRAEFSPNMPGSHEIAVYHRSKMVKGSPFLCHVYDPQKVLIGSIPTAMTVGQSITLPGTNDGYVYNLT